MTRDSTEEQALAIAEGVEETLRSRWLQLSKQKFNPNVKGQGFEEAAAEFLETYLGGPLELQTRVALLDQELALLDELAPAENEWDLIAVYRSAIPRLILQVENLKFVPLDACFFVAEVKKVMTSQSLKSDLEKLAKIRGFESSGRLGVTITGAYSETKVLSILLYHETQVSPKRFRSLVEEYLRVWDLVLALDKGSLFVNGSLKIARAFGGEPQPVYQLKEFPVLNLLIMLSASMSASPGVNTAATWHRLLQVAFEMRNKD